MCSGGNGLDTLIITINLLISVLSGGCSIYFSLYDFVKIKTYVGDLLLTSTTPASTLTSDLSPSTPTGGCVKDLEHFTRILLTAEMHSVLFYILFMLMDCFAAIFIAYNQARFLNGGTSVTETSVETRKRTKARMHFSWWAAFTLVLTVALSFHVVFLLATSDDGDLLADVSLVALLLSKVAFFGLFAARLLRLQRNDNVDGYQNKKRRSRDKSDASRLEEQKISGNLVKSELAGSKLNLNARSSSDYKKRSENAREEGRSSEVGCQKLDGATDVHTTNEVVTSFKKDSVNEAVDVTKKYLEAGDVTDDEFHQQTQPTPQLIQQIVKSSQEILTQETLPTRTSSQEAPAPDLDTQVVSANESKTLLQAAILEVRPLSPEVALTAPVETKESASHELATGIKELPAESEVNESSAQVSSNVEINTSERELDGDEKKGEQVCDEDPSEPTLDAKENENAEAKAAELKEETGDVNDVESEAERKGPVHSLPEKITLVSVSSAEEEGDDASDGPLSLPILPSSPITV